MAAMPGAAAASDAHRHHDVLEAGRSGTVSSALALLSCSSIFTISWDVGQHVDQVGDVEADVDGVAAVVDLELFLGLFLLGVADAMRSTPGSMFTRTPLNFSLVRMAARCRQASSGARPSVTLLRWFFGITRL
jgi:hypothetical protein